MAFLALTEALRGAHPLTTNVMGSVAIALANGRYDEGHCWVVEDSGTVVGAALRTPPYKLLLSPMPADAVAPLLDRIDGDDPEWNGFLTTPAVAERVRATSHKRFVEGMKEWILVLDSLIPVRAPGGPTRSTEDDLRLLMSWLKAFADEAGVEFAATEEQMRPKAARGGFTFWDLEGEHVALASHAPLVTSGSHTIGRIGPVYTLPEFRKRGIGAAITSIVARDLIDAGCTTVMLHTDASNPTSNGVYERIGFVRVDQVQEWSAAE